MRSLLLSITFFLTFLFSFQAQETSLNDKIVEYIEINGTEAQYANAVDELFIMLSRRYAHLDVPQTVWQELEAEYKPKSLKSIKFLLVTPYRTTFSKDNVERMLKFYKSDVGQQMLANPTSLSTEQKAIAGDFYASDAGAKLLENKEELERKVSEVSEIWSRDLYRAVTNDLSERGYSIDG